MPLALLVVIFIGVPIAELYLIYKVGDAIGVLPTLLLLAADSVLGSLLLRSQGRSVWRRFNETMAAGRVPHKELQHGVAVIFGAAFLITPGFLTDVIGLLLLLPPTRAAILRLATRAIARRVSARVTARGERRGQPGPGDVEGTATEHPGSRRSDSPSPPRLER
ncbi:MAG: FxsA family protein [Actinomycetota bacterium]|nr:FxsA family protein [Actinomycetota bacterium]